MINEKPALRTRRK